MCNSSMSTKPLFLPLSSVLQLKGDQQKDLRATVSMHQTNSGKSRKFVESSKFAFTPTFIFCSPICPNNCGVVFFL